MLLLHACATAGQMHTVIHTLIFNWTQISREALVYHMANMEILYCRDQHAVILKKLYM